MKKALLILGLSLVTVAGCRQVSNDVQNYITLQSQAGSIYLSDVNLGDGSNDATQAADKDYKDSFGGNTAKVSPTGL